MIYVFDLIINVNIAQPPTEYHVILKRYKDNNLWRRRCADFYRSRHLLPVFYRLICRRHEGYV